MSEHELREGLRAAVAEEPPLVFDADRLVEQAQRGRRRRRSLLAAGGATFLVVAAAVAVPLTLGGRQQLVPVASPGLTTMATSSRPAATPAPTADPARADIAWPPTGVRPADYTARQLSADAGRFDAHLTTTLPKVVPGLVKPQIGTWGGEASGPVPSGQRYLASTIRFLRGDAITSVMIQVNGPGQDDAFTPAQVCGPGNTGCLRKPTPNGGELVTVSFDNGGGRLTQTVYDFRSDGSLVFVTGYNYDMTSSEQRVATKTVSLTTAELTDLALDPVLHL